MSSKKPPKLLPVSNQTTFFGGTSVTALINQPILAEAITLQGYDHLAQIIAKSYKEEAQKILPVLNNAFTAEECALFQQHGLFYGLHISPKLLALSEGLIVEHKELLLPGFPEPYQLPKHPPEIINAYFQELKVQRGIDIELSSLILADTTTPKGYEGKKILNPSHINEKLTHLSQLITEKLKESNYLVDSLYLLSTDTDSPDRLLLSTQKKILSGYPLTPGVTLCGSTAAIDGFDFRYIYRMGLIAQQISSNIIASRLRQEYTPFVFFGMLSPFGYTNGAIPVGKMGNLRYSGNIDLKKEFGYVYENTITKLME